MADGSTLQAATEQAPSLFIPRESFHVLQNVDPAEVLRQWASGQTLKQIAKQHGVGPAAITQWLDRNVSKEDRELARELHYQTKLDDGLEELEVAGHDVNLARAREPYLRRLEWRAQTECKRWQQKQTTIHEVGPDLGDLLRTAKQRVSQAGHTAAQQLPDDEAHNRTIIATPDEYTKE